jgi:hypothetical protein
VLSLIWHYVIAVGQQWYTLVTGGLLVLDQLLKSISPKAKTWLDSKWPEGQRRPAEVTALVAILVVAGFEAYRGEHQGREEASAARIEAEKALAAAQGELRILRERAPVAAISTPAVTAPRRLINYGGVGFDTVSSGEFAIFLREVYFDIKNVGEDPLRLRLVSGALLIDGKLGLVCAPEDAKYLGKGETVKVSCRPETPERGLVSMDAKEVQLRTRVEYDTIPATAVRTSIRESRAPVLTPRSTGGGFGFPAFTLTKSVEH